MGGEVIACFGWFSVFSKHLADKGKHQHAMGNEKLLLHKKKQLRIMKLGDDIICRKDQKSLYILCKKYLLLSTVNAFWSSFKTYGKIAFHTRKKNTS